MSERIEAYGRVNGNVRFHYGPRKFDADWGGVFTAFEIIELIQDIAEVRTGHIPLHKKLGVKEQGKKLAGGFAGEFSQRAADDLALRICLDQIDICMLEIDSLMISAVKVKPLWIDQRLPSGLIRNNAELHSRRVAEALLKMDLNKWGVVRQIGIALSRFIDAQTSGRRSASVFLTI